MATRVDVPSTKWAEFCLGAYVAPICTQKRRRKGHKAYYDKGVLMVKFNLEWLLNRKDIGSSHAAHGNEHRPA